MRKIKFRAKSIYNNKWWSYGNLRIYADKAFISPIYSHAEDKVKLSTVGQFTGLIDRNGKEIYEDDIVEYYDDIEDELVKGLVRYEADVCSFCIIPSNASEKFGLTQYWHVKVIGNIHDNPELMKGGVNVE